MSDDDDHAPARDELTEGIAADILSLPELAEPTWDAFAMAVEVTDDFVAVTAYRYTGTGDPVSTEEPEDVDVFWDLWDRDGRVWDVVLVRVHRGVPGLEMTFLAGAEADRWRVTPANIGHLPESLRPVRGGAS
jgi:hypothetical protein